MRETTAVAIGLALYWPMLRSPYFQNLFFASSSTAISGREAYAIASALIAALGILALGKARRSPHDATLPARAPSSLLAGFVCAIGAMLSIVSAQLASPFASAAQLMGIALFAVGFSALTVGWFSLLVADDREWSLFAAVSFVASFASVGIEYLPDNAIQVSLVAFPLTTATFLAIANHLAEQRGQESAPVSRPALSPSIDAAVLVATCFCLIASAPSLCLFAPTRGYMPTAETPKTYVFSMLVAIAIAGITRLRRPFPIRQGIVLIVLSALLVAGALAVASTDNAMPLAATVHTCLQFALFLSLLSFWRKKGSGGFGGAGAFLVITSLITVASRYLLPIAFPKDSPEPISTMLGMLSIVILSVAGMCLALFAMLRLPSLKDDARDANAMDEKPPTKASPEPTDEKPLPAPTQASPSQPPAQESDDALRAWFESSFSLSPRETDIALLVARGYTVNRIAEKLCLASGTVQSHMKSIYRKLDVHSKQEVIDLVQMR